ncbi:ABC transporter permease subunit [Gleimia sp. 6138-11-ORH1]|uniref:ABC transporter permease subunit n=1 Tax=Gleimia sp. 6138-11-ORH1 TaxID=2973937 RepID=UPI002166CE40|nr:ABC transporter permease subunit [Gleimia sp. 6138-11-ORH1]MCS4485002.1 ABC transporter permease subunit [Gleimia sp. 6138-11-ORH1]
MSVKTDQTSRSTKNKPATGDSPATMWSAGFFIKLFLMALVNALGVYIIVSAYTSQSWIIFGASLTILLLVDYVYFSPRTLALKYMAPGLVFLLIFQVFVMGYTGYIAFTNYGDRHLLDKDSAAQSLLRQRVDRVEGTAEYPLTIVESNGEFGFAIIDGDDVKVGTAKEPFQKVEGVKRAGNILTEVPGWEIVNVGKLGERQAEVIALRVPLTDDPKDGLIGTQNASTGYVFESTMTFDKENYSLTDLKTGKVYTADDTVGFYVAEDGERLDTGYQIWVGLDNFKRAFSDSRYSTPFFKVLLWTVAFAFLSVITTFLLGMILALVMNDSRMGGRKIYRTLMLMPYAFPAFMSAFLFAGMLNAKYGFFNQVFFGGAEIPWLTDPWLAKGAVLFVNLWMGFPYMFLICTGALQSIPSELNEAAKIDGATGFQIWRYVTMPQLMIQVSPLLIASFAFNFNNFNLIYMLTNGGPAFKDASVPVGHTDILISMVYSVAGLSGKAARDYGLASAMSIMIFIIVGTVSMISFKRSKSIEGAQ